MTPRPGNETARSVQLIGVGLGEVAVKPGQGRVSVPGSGNELSGCPAYRDLGISPSTRSIAACAPSMNPLTAAFSFGIARTARKVGKAIP